MSNCLRFALEHHLGHVAEGICTWVEGNPLFEALEGSVEWWQNRLLVVKGVRLTLYKVQACVADESKVEVLTIEEGMQLLDTIQAGVLVGYYAEDKSELHAIYFKRSGAEMQVCDNQHPKLRNPWPGFASFVITHVAT